MIFTQVSFHLNEPISLEEATAIFESTAPKYKGHPGLKQKFYFRRDDGSVVGGLYFWENRASAEATYNETWKAMVSEKYGAAPEISYFDAPVSVVNSPLQ